MKLLLNFCLASFISLIVNKNVSNKDSKFFLKFFFCVLSSNSRKQFRNSTKLKPFYTGKDFCKFM